MIAAMHAELVESLRIGLTVFLRGDAALRDARRLVARKRVLRRQEAEAAGLNIHSPQTAASGSDAVATRVVPVIFSALSATCGASIRISQRSPTRSSNARPSTTIETLNRSP